MTEQIVSVALIILGVVVVIFVAKNVDPKGGRISKLFSGSPLNVKVLKLGMAALPVSSGGALLFGGGHL